MHVSPIFRRPLLTALALVWVLGCQTGRTASTVGNSARTNTDQLTLRVALYPYVPRLQQFKDVLADMWTRDDVALEIVSWDGYDQDPPASLDVFVFDAIFLDYFRAKGYLHPIAADDIEHLDDFLDYAITGSRAGDVYYALPQLGCASLLFYREDDTQLANARTLDEIADAVGTCTYTDTTPPAGHGLMIDMSGGTTVASYYIEADEDLRHQYTPSPTLPDADALDPAVLDQLTKVLSLASVANARSYNDDNPYQRATWFGQGLGRANVGFTESMSAMGEARERVDFKPLPMDGAPDITLFYSDMVGVNSAITDARERAAAVQLANLLTSSAYIVRAFGPSASDETPQYLMPVRHSAFERLGQTLPLYREMRAMVERTTPHLFRLGETARPWLESQKSAIRDKVYDSAVCPAAATENSK